MRNPVLTETLYKITGPKGTAVHGGRYRYPGLGRWTKKIDDINPCSRGYHLTTFSGLCQWIYPDGLLFVAEGDGEPVWHQGKAVFGRVRLVERVGVLSERNLRLWSADCAERVVHLTALESSAEPDPRSLAAIEAARRFARGEIGKEELAVARSAAWDAVRDADSTAMAAGASTAAFAARSAAWDAAWDVTWDVAWAASTAARDAAQAAASAAAEDSEKAWQEQRLIAILRGDQLPPASA